MQDVLDVYYPNVDNPATIAGAWNFTAAPTKSGLGIPYYVTASYVGGKISVQASAPTSPAVGDMWFDTDAGAVAEVNDLTASVTWADVPIANIPTGTTSSTVALGNHTHSGMLTTSTADTRYGYGTTGPAVGSQYQYRWRSHATSPVNYFRQAGTGDIVRFIGSATAGATSGTKQVTITNAGGITATDDVTCDDVIPNATNTYNLGTSSLEWLNLYVTNIQIGSTSTTLTQKAAGVLGIEGYAAFKHASTSYTSAEITFSSGVTPTTQGANGDIWFKY